MLSDIHVVPHVFNTTFLENEWMLNDVLDESLILFQAS